MDVGQTVGWPTFIGIAVVGISAVGTFFYTSSVVSYILFYVNSEGVVMLTKKWRALWSFLRWHSYSGRYFMSLVCNSSLRFAILVQSRKQLWNMRTFQIPVVPCLQDMECRRTSARLLYTTVGCLAGRPENTAKKLVSMLTCFLSPRQS